ncbi:MAG: LolA family protein [Bacteroidota bacterium]
MRRLLLLALLPSLTPAEVIRSSAIDWGAIETLSVKATRITTKGPVTQREQWKFSFRQPDSFRLDYSYPQERVIAADGRELVEYLPALKQAVRTRFETPANGEALKKKILNRVALTGSHFGSPETLLRVFDWEMGGTGPLIGRAKRGDGKMLLWLNQDGLEKGELYDEKNQLVLRQTARDFRRVGPLSFPLETKTEFFRPEAVCIDLRLRELRINEPLETRFLLPPGVGITERRL